MNLQLSLKKQWFDLTKSGIKTEDYREVTPYWCSRFFKKHGHSMMYEDYRWEDLCSVLKNPNESVNFIMDLDCLKFKTFTTTTLTSGYPKSTDTDRIIKFEHAGIEIRTGNPEWGAEEGKLYFVVKHGKQIN